MKKSFATSIPVFKSFFFKKTGVSSAFVVFVAKYVCFSNTVSGFLPMIPVLYYIPIF